MDVLGNLNILEILKLGLPGLVFMLSLFSYRLLSQEQKKKDPSNPILKSIKCYMYVNIFLAILTISAPFIEANYLNSKEMQIFNVEAMVSKTPLASGKAAVCLNAEYSGRYLLIVDRTTLKMVQVEAMGILPCTSGDMIALSEEDVKKLGWTDFSKGAPVDVAAAEQGQMYILNEGIRRREI
jgi:hypothetical protein